MSKHKFLFKHSLLYSNSKLSSFKNIYDFTRDHETEISNEPTGNTPVAVVAKSVHSNCASDISRSLASGDKEKETANHANLLITGTGTEREASVTQSSLTDYLEDDFLIRPPIEIIIIEGQCQSKFSRESSAELALAAHAEQVSLPSWVSDRENEIVIENEVISRNPCPLNESSGANEVASKGCNWAAEGSEGFSYATEYFRFDGLEDSGKINQPMAPSDAIKSVSFPDLFTERMPTNSILEASSIPSVQDSRSLEDLVSEDCSLTVHRSLHLDSHRIEEGNFCSKQNANTSRIGVQKSIPTGVITRAPAAPKSLIAAQSSSVKSSTETTKDINAKKPSNNEVVTEKRRGTKRVWSLVNIITHEGNPTTYECKVCSKKFKTKSNCKYHQHDDGSYPYVCATCGKGMMAKTHYEYHLKTHTGLKSHTCSECPRGFITAKDLSRHQLIHRNEHSHNCSICPRGFHSEPELRRHLAKHNGTQSYSCEICSKKFTVLSELRLHESIHEGTQKFKCTVCTKGFLRQKHLAEHMRIHTGEKPFKCATCPRQFRLESSLDRHNRNHAKDRPYQCSFPSCTRDFLVQKDCIRHQLVHKGEASFKCEFCDKCFRRNDNLKRHIRLHHTEDDITIDTSLFT